MADITVTRETTAPVSDVWAILDDFGGIHRFSAGVERSPINPGTPSSGVGSERNCVLYDGNNLQERVTASVEGKKLDIEIFQTSMPIKDASGGFTLAPTPSGGTQITMRMQYTVKFGPLGMLMDAVMMKRMMTGSLDRLLAALDHHVVTGEEIGKDWTPPANAATTSGLAAQGA